jgi:hypothetical protein
MYRALILVALAAGSYALNTPKNGARSPLPRALRVRGGAGIDSDLAIKLATGMLGANGLALAVSPDEICKVYGCESGGINSFMAEGIGHQMVGICVLVHSLRTGAGLERAVAYGCVPSLIHLYKMCATKNYAQYSVPDAAPLAWLAITGATCLSLWNGVGDADLIMKAFTCILGLNGAFLAANPDKGCEAYGMPGGGWLSMFMRLMGVANLAQAVIQGAMVFQGADPTLAIGYANVIFALHAAYAAFIDGPSRGMKTPPLYFNTALTGLIAYSCIA